VRQQRTWRAGWSLVLLVALLAASELVGAPRVTVHSPTGLYLLAQFKLAVGDTGSGLELLDRAFAARDSVVFHADSLHASHSASCIVAP
jgi:hypothetical protein